jgi:ATP-dependent helicase HrpA
VVGLGALYQQVYPESAKYLRKQLLKGLDLQLKSAVLPGKGILIPLIIDMAYRQALLESRPIPRSSGDFDKSYKEGKSQIVSVANEIESLIVTMLPLLSEIRKTLKKQSLTAMHAVTDINQQLTYLFSPEYLVSVPIEWLRNYPRYLKAIQNRLEKLPLNPKKDKESWMVLDKLEQRLADFSYDWSDLPLSTQSEVWKHRFMLQEYRVSLFSQQLKTVFPISDKRIDGHWKGLASLISSYHSDVGSNA